MPVDSNHVCRWAAILQTARRTLAYDTLGVTGWYRPSDLRLFRPALYHLSYRHVEARTGIEPMYAGLQPAA